MATLTLTADAQEAATPPLGRLLRISRQGEDERLVELSDGKCTIGSSLRCQICLPASDARPMQCLVTLEADAATVTRWAAGVLLNGQEFATAPLAAGDRLSIGPWDIAWASAPATTTPVAEAASQFDAACEFAQDSLAAALAEESATHPELESSAFAAILAPEPPFDEQFIESELAPPQAPDELGELLELDERSPVVEIDSLVGPSQLLQVEEALAGLMAETTAPAPASSERPGAITVPMASRQTEPIVEAVAQRPSRVLSQTFADRLLVHLWTANHQARLRCFALVDSVRGSRGEAARAMAHAAAATNDLSQACAAHQAYAASWNATFAELHDEIAARTAAQGRLENELADLAQRKAAAVEATERLAELTHALAVAERTADELRAELAGRTQQVDELIAERAASEEVRNLLEEQLQREQQRAEMLADASDQLATLTQQLAAAERSATELRAELADRSGLVDALTAECATREVDRVRLEEQLQSEHERADALAETAGQLAGLTQQLAAAEHLATELREALAHRAQQVGELTAERLHGEEVRAHLEAQLKREHERAAAVTDAADQLAELAQQLAAAEFAADELRTELAGRDRRLDELATEHASGEETRTRLEEQLDREHERVVALAEAAERLAELTQELAAAEQAAGELRAELAERDQQVELLSNARNSEGDLRTRLEEELHSEQERAEYLAASLQRLESDHAAAIQAALEERDDLRQALAELEAAALLPTPPVCESAEPSVERQRLLADDFAPDAATVDGGDEASDASPLETQEPAIDSPLESASQYSDGASLWPTDVPEVEQNSAAEIADDAPPTDLAEQASIDEWDADQVGPAVAADEHEIPADVDHDGEQDSGQYDELALMATQSSSHFGFLEAPLEESLEPPADEPTPAISSEDAEPAYAPPSFIDRYRELMDDDAATDSPMADSPARALLDEEFLSPSEARTGDDPDDDADEALEAYMSNLMRRVRGDSGLGSTGLLDRATSLTRGLIATPEPEPTPLPVTLPTEPLNLESLRTVSRQPARPLDLVAMREIANDSARIAFAEHKERRHVDSMINRGILFAITAGSSAYALYSAPSVGSPWFWAGAAAAFAAGGLGIQLALLLRRRMALYGRRLDPLAAIVAPIDFSVLSEPLPAPVLES